MGTRLGSTRVPQGFADSSCGVQHEAFSLADDLQLVATMSAMSALLYDTARARDRNLDQVIRYLHECLASNRDRSFGAY